MKKFLKLTVFILATMLIVTGCKKENKNTIIGKWKLENEIKFSTTLNTQDPILQLVVPYLIEQMFNGDYFNVLSAGTYDFRKDGKVFLLQYGVSIEGDYTIVDDVLTIVMPGVTSMGATGKINISSKTMLWDLDVTAYLGAIDDDTLDKLIKGFPFLEDIENVKDIIKVITKIVLQATFSRQ
jgi:hypothetical protein